jgi:hypothetical protein
MIGYFRKAIAAKRPAILNLRNLITEIDRNRDQQHLIK